MKELRFKIETTPIWAEIVLSLKATLCFSLGGKLVQLIGEHTQCIRAPVDRNLLPIFRQLHLQEMTWQFHRHLISIWTAHFGVFACVACLPTKMTGFCMISCMNNYRGATSGWYFIGMQRNLLAERSPHSTLM